MRYLIRGFLLALACLLLTYAGAIAATWGYLEGLRTYDSWIMR